MEHLVVKGFVLLRIENFQGFIIIVIFVVYSTSLNTFVVSSTPFYLFGLSVVEFC